VVEPRLLDDWCATCRVEPRCSDLRPGTHHLARCCRSTCKQVRPRIPARSRTTLRLVVAYSWRANTRDDRACPAWSTMPGVPVLSRPADVLGHGRNVVRWSPRGLGGGGRWRAVIDASPGRHPHCHQHRVILPWANTSGGRACVQRLPRGPALARPPPHDRHRWNVAAVRPALCRRRVGPCLITTPPPVAVSVRGFPRWALRSVRHVHSGVVMRTGCACPSDDDAHRTGPSPVSSCWCRVGAARPHVSALSVPTPCRRT